VYYRIWYSALVVLAVVGCGCVEQRHELCAVNIMWLAVVVWSCVVRCVQCTLCVGCGCVELRRELCEVHIMWLAVVVWSCVVSCVQ